MRKVQRAPQAPPKSPSEEWKKEFVGNIQKYLLRGNYHKGLEIARSGLSQYPKEFECRLQYAKLLGDWADELPPSKKAKLKKEAIQILKPLMRALSGKTPRQRFSACLNYYYQSQNYKGMAVFGRRLSKRRDRNGYYAQALGACLHAQKLHDKKKVALAKRWAEKSVASWKKYDLSKEKYYFAHYSLALALALSGDTKSAMTRLLISARLSDRKVTDWEFADVLNIIKSNA
jgi:hypothetical protein